MIIASQISKSYGDSVVIDGVSVSIPAGGVTSIIGPNGAGKSTLLSIVARLMSMDTGTVTVDGLDVTKTPPIRWRSGSPSCGRTITSPRA